MKRIFFITTLLLTYNSIFAQKAIITAEQATMGYQMGLYPESYYNILEVKNTPYFLHVIPNEGIAIKDSQTGKLFKFITNNKLPEKTHFADVVYADETIIVYKHENSFFLYNYNDEKLISKLMYPKEGENAVYNNASKTVAFTMDNNLYYTNEKGSIMAITDIADVNIVSGQSIHRSEFGIKEGIFYSPKGNYIAFYQKDERNVTNYPLIDNTKIPAEVKNIKYPMAGSKSEMAYIGIFNLKTKQTNYLKIDTQDEHYLTNLSWSPDEKYIIIAEINREQNFYELNQYSTTSFDKVKTLYSEKNEKWVEPEHPAIFLPLKTDEFVWISEKDGFNNLYIINFKGQEKKLTSFKWVVKNILGFDNTKENIFVEGTGIDPRENHLFKINLKTGKHIALTSKKGTNNAVLVHNGAYFINQFSNISTPNIVESINTKNGKETTLMQSTNPFENYHMGSVEFVTLKADDDKTNLYGKIIKPCNFDPQKTYPVLLYVYGGPHAQLVVNNWTADTPLWQLAFSCEQNYIIFTIDNRGTENRGTAFEQVIHRDLLKYALKDQLKGVEYLKELPFIDKERIAVYGWSFGGFMASSLMLHNPNTFKTCIAGGAVTNWKFYEVMYGERYMDKPSENPEGYEKTRVSKYLKNLEGKMLFIHGYQDDVVLPQHFFELNQAAVNSFKNIDFFIYPQHKHNVQGYDRVHLTKIIKEYLLENNQ